MSADKPGMGVAGFSPPETAPRRKPPTRRQQRLWAIDTCSDEGHGFIGRFWTEEGFTPWPSCVPVGPRLFGTRQEARNFLQKIKQHVYQAFPKARVVRALVTVEVVR